MKEGSRKESRRRKVRRKVRRMEGKIIKKEEGEEKERGWNEALKIRKDRKGGSIEGRDERKKVVKKVKQGRK